MFPYTYNYNDFQEAIFMKLALLVANRGFFPSSVIESARADMLEAFKKAGVECLTIDADSVKYGAVESTAEGMIFADFLEAHRGEFDGIVICLPNFGDENGIKAAIRNIDVPVLIQAYPDEFGKMDFSHRRDAFCGKLALTSVLTQMGVKYTEFMPFVVHPLSDEFDIQLKKFVGICRVVKGMTNVRIGTVGARTTAFKSVRFDEIALERHKIDTEDYDLSMILDKIKKLDDSASAVKDWLEKLYAVADFSKAPVGRDILMAKLGAVLEDLVNGNKLDALAIRCWSELQEQLGITPCAVMGIFNGCGIPATCEMDVTNTVTMLALALASGNSSGCLDLNNNYGSEPDKCIAFHCGPLPMQLMQGKGEIQQHKMLSKTYGEGCSWGLNVGKIITGEITYASARTDNGNIQYYVDKGIFTDDEVEKEFFGIHAVLETQNLQKKLYNISKSGFRHHVTITSGDVVDIMNEALTNYLGYEKIDIER